MLGTSAFSGKIFFNFSKVSVDIPKKKRIISICMDKKKDCKIPKCGSLSDITGKQVIVGTKQLRKALQKGCAEYVFLAENADPAVTDPIAELCRTNHIQITWIRTMAELGSACGIEVGAAAAAVIAS